MSMPTSIPDPSSLLARRGLGLLLAVAIALAPWLPAAAQGPVAKTAQGDAAEAPATETEAPDPDYSKPMGPDDPFNRGTPRGSIYGFIVAANAGDYERAAEFLDLRRLSDGEVQGPELAKEIGRTARERVAARFTPEEQIDRIAGILARGLGAGSAW